MEPDVTEVPDKTTEKASTLKLIPAPTENAVYLNGYLDGIDYMLKIFIFSMAIAFLLIWRYYGIIDGRP